MGELINGRTPEEIKKALNICVQHDRDKCDECPYEKKCGRKDEGLLQDIIALIEHLEAAQPKWISVEERLPEAEGMYIVYIPLTGETIIAADYLDGHWIDWEVDLTEHVTHWMPLPSVPKGE